MTRPHRGEIALARATPQQLRRLAAARQWLVAPDVIESMKDPSTMERQKLQAIDRLVLPGSIDLIVSDRVPRGHIIPQELYVPPRSAGALLQARPQKEVQRLNITRLVVWGLIAVGVVAFWYIVLSWLFTLAVG